MAGTDCDSSTELDPGIYKSRPPRLASAQPRRVIEMEVEEFECNINMIRKSLLSVCSVSGAWLDTVFHV